MRLSKSKMAVNKLHDLSKKKDTRTRRNDVERREVLEEGGIVEKNARCGARSVIIRRS